MEVDLPQGGGVPTRRHQVGQVEPGSLSRRSGGPLCRVSHATEGELTPNITPDSSTGIGDWTAEQIVKLLKTGENPDGADVQGLMEEIIENGYRYMTDEDREAIAFYLRTIRPIQNNVEGE